MMDMYPVEAMRARRWNEMFSVTVCGLPVSQNINQKRRHLKAAAQDTGRSSYSGSVYYRLQTH